MNEKMSLYESVAQRISYLIDEGTFRPGDRIPSIRNLSQQFGVSINTIKQSYAFMEDRRLIEARPQGTLLRLPGAEPADFPTALSRERPEAPAKFTVRVRKAKLQRVALVRIPHRSDELFRTSLEGER